MESNTSPGLSKAEHNFPRIASDLVVFLFKPVPDVADAVAPFGMEFGETDGVILATEAFKSAS